MATRFMAEPEGRRKIVGDIYLRFLRRDPTTAEANGWVDQVAAGKTEVDVGIGLVAGTEYFTRPTCAGSGTVLVGAGLGADRAVVGGLDDGRHRRAHACRRGRARLGLTGHGIGLDHPGRGLGSRRLRFVRDGRSIAPPIGPRFVFRFGFVGHGTGPTHSGDAESAVLVTRAASWRRREGVRTQERSSAGPEEAGRW